jgi:hypothetical protein
VPWGVEGALLIHVQVERGQRTEEESRRQDPLPLNGDRPGNRSRVAPPPIWANSILCARLKSGERLARLTPGDARERLTAYSEAQAQRLWRKRSTCQFGRRVNRAQVRLPVAPDGR